jgi:Holliday junction DNA helicase RuvA
MIALLRGVIVDRGIDHVVVDVGGVGYRVTVSLQTLASLPPQGASTQLFTQLQVREDALTLVGFATVEERTAFELVTAVQGVGNKIAMALLSALAPLELAACVKAEDVARLRRIPGVGQKTAERLVLELRDKLEKAGLRAGAPSGKAPAVAGEDRMAEQVASALVNLGYRPAEAERAAAEAVRADKAASVTELVRRALRALAE